ncbi:MULTISPECIES: KDGP aldolase [unclassified Paenibacillus]|uniref:2-dehydro-3-deoxy-phosphogluconate aldolase n=1 Tax=unclassified Paenibacillus TaxID=185978 RepID=UPI000CFAC096|nr:MULTISPECIES: KDGP aldolase [unclassified Paenibacillus]MBD8836544.1 oxo-acid lyase [Paenibacillus sp. CFBP 13594]PRA04969.1 2-dehydro-3-deoxyphosphooctonate aldolase [Paenibacillus sp. MYb63]PRA47686.1 2-dehydro-3-deoxyphosphooctonate aldolase [Paenibacillus sp. MYb67]QZN74846.1 KDGP aldolase [Paenibacillus sp. DR312]
MSHIQQCLYKNRAAINVLAGSIGNARDVYEAAEGYVLVGVLSKNYATSEEAVVAMTEYGQAIQEAVSIGLGAGDSRQAAVVAEIAASYPGSHINQVFPAVGATRANLGPKDSWINCLVSPCGQPGYVNISTGPVSSVTTPQAIVPVHAAIALVRDMGGNALKYYPMQGLNLEEEYRAVAKACGEANFALEPTGGIDLDNFGPILEIALQAGVPQVIPHVYSSIIDSQTGSTNVQDVHRLLETMKSLVDRYA